MNSLPLFVPILFLTTVLLCVYFFYLASQKSKLVISILVAWMFLQSGLALSDFYLVSNSLPPRFVLLVFPSILFILLLLISRRGRIYIDSLNLKWLTLIHLVRIPVEIILFYLYISKCIPELMTFEGKNFDILSGMSVVPVFFFAFRRNRINKQLLVIWNFVALLLVLNIMFTGILSSPSPIQQLSFDQPNIAVLHFPFNLLPSIVVPLVLFSHIASLYKLNKFVQKK